MTTPSPKRAPFQGLRVLDSSYIYAGPYCAALMADHGAEVIKVEGPTHFDHTRRGGNNALFPDGKPDADEWWNQAGSFNVVNRGKQAITLDMNDEKCRDLFRELVKVSDIVMENFTPRIMKRWGLDYPELRKLRPDIIMVSNTGYGHGDGPYASYPAVASAMEPTQGLAYTTGYRGGPPARAGVSYVDFVACWTMLFAIAGALRRRQRTGQGQWIDVAMYQAGMMGVSEYLVDFSVNGNPGERIGNRNRFHAPQGVYPTREADQWVAIAISTEAQWHALSGATGATTLTTDARFADNASRLRHHDALDARISEWTSRHERYELMKRLQAGGVPAAPVLDGADLHTDPHIRARGLLEPVAYPPARGIGTRPLIGRPWRMSNDPASIAGPAPRLGEHNAEVFLGLLGLTPDEVAAMERDKVISQKPIPPQRPQPFTDEELVRWGNVKRVDPEYRRHL